MLEGQIEDGTSMVVILEKIGGLAGMVDSGWTRARPFVVGGIGFPTLYVLHISQAARLGSPLIQVAVGHLS